MVITADASFVHAQNLEMLSCMLVVRKKADFIVRTNLLRHYVNILSMTLCYICNTRTSTMSCPECKKPVCKQCTRDFPFSASLCLECAASVKTGLGGVRKDGEEIF